MHAGLLILTITILATSAQVNQSTPGPASPGVVLKAAISAQDPQRRTAAIGLGREAGVSVGDPFWVVSDSRVYGWGSIYLITDTACVGRLTAARSKLPKLEQHSSCEGMVCPHSAIGCPSRPRSAAN